MKQKNQDSFIRYLLTLLLIGATTIITACSNGGGGGNLPVVSIANASVSEGNSGTASLTFTVSLSGQSSSDVTVDYATFDDTATAGSDYTAANGTLTIPAGSTSGTIAITVNGDTTFELDEMLILALSNVSANATLGDDDDIAVGIITNDDDDRTWVGAAPIETDNRGNAESPQIAFDSSGNAIAVWHQADGIRANIWANRYVPGKGWGTAALIDTDNGYARYPQIAFDSSGNAIAVWEQRDGTYANRYVPGKGWGTAALIDTDNAGDARHPQIAFDSSGNAIAVWHQWDGARYSIWANRYVPGKGWGTAELIETDNAGDARYPQIAIDSSGNAIAVWQQHDGKRYNIWANRYVPGKGWGTAELIVTDNVGGAGTPQIAFDSSGNAIAVWAQGDGIRANIWANRYVPGKGWGTAALIETDNAGGAYNPQIAFDSSGNAIAVWQQFDGTRVNIYANRYVSGTGAWAGKALIETDDAGDAENPQIAFDSSGNAIAVWQQSDGTRVNIYANRFE